jgi:hypothetical protein
MLAKPHRPGELTAIWIPMHRTKQCETWCGREQQRGGYLLERDSICKTFWLSGAS